MPILTFICNSILQLRTTQFYSRLGSVGRVESAQI